MEELLYFLNNISPLGPSPIFTKPLSAALQEHLRYIVKQKNVAKNEYLLQAGEISKEVYFIQSGLLRCFFRRDDLKEVNRWFMSEGDVVFSIRSFHQQIPGDEYIQALEASTLWYISYNELEDVYMKFPEFERIGRLLEIRYHILWDQQYFGLQMKTAQERHDWLRTYFPHLPLRVAQKHIASWLGISEEHYSVIKGQR